MYRGNNEEILMYIVNDDLINIITGYWKINLDKTKCIIVKQKNKIDNNTHIKINNKTIEKVETI